MQRVLIVSNRLPVKFQKKEKQLTVKPSEGGLATGLSSVYKQGSNLWIGWPGTYITSEKDKKQVKSVLKKENMLPVYLSKNEIREYYEGFCNETIWPIFHYFLQHAIYNDTYWQTYKKVNQKFLKELLKIIKKDDIIWIHDYQLLLLPGMIREVYPDATIGFFLHIPFPSYELFRLLPWRKELLIGMLGADLIGFHTYEYVKHFLNAVSYGVGLNHTSGPIEFNNRIILTDAFPMGIDYNKFQKNATAAKTISEENKFRNAIGNHKIILSIDRLDYSKGIIQRLEAFEKFLKQHPEWRTKVSLVQILVPSRDKVKSYKNLKEDINRMVGNINSSYGSLEWTPVYYFYRAFPSESLSAFYHMADVCLVTPMRDGMNLVAKEYVASKTDKKGVLILSEMAGAAIELADALIVNPNNSGEISEAIHSGLTMPLKEQQRRMELMQQTVEKFNIYNWVNLFMTRLGVAKEAQQALITKVIDNQSAKEISRQYLSTNKRTIFLDYDGTLVPFALTPDKAKPDAKLLSLLAELSEDLDNTVVLISGRNKEVLEKWFGKLPLVLVAEHGIWVKEINADWAITEICNKDWIPFVKPILEQYSDRTPGSFLEEKDYSIVWHYRKVEPGLGDTRTIELVNHLKNLQTEYNLQLLQGNKVVEIKNSEVNKGKTAMQLLLKYESDFILSLGDDFTDEDLFKMLPETAITIKVRDGLSNARFSLKSYKEVRIFLKKLIQSRKPQAA